MIAEKIDNQIKDMKKGRFSLSIQDLISDSASTEFIYTSSIGVSIAESI
jgi:hypothetical protein